jgi:hypothetical protein
MIHEQLAELRPSLIGNRRCMIERVLSSDYHNRDGVPKSDPLQALAQVQLFDQPVCQNIESHSLSSAMKLLIPSKYGGGTLSTNRSREKANDSRVLHSLSPCKALRGQALQGNGGIPCNI